MVNKPNVRPEKWKNYEIPDEGKYVDDSYKKYPYDYTSIMHYGKYSFVKDDKEVIH